MSHPGDKPVQRFVAYLVGFGAMIAFGVLAPVLSWSGSLIWPRRSAVDEIGAQRAEGARNLRAEQRLALVTASTDPATKTTRVPVAFVAKNVLPQLKSKAASQSSLVVPGSAAALRAMQPPASPAAPAAVAPKPEAPQPAPPKAVPAPPKAVPAPPTPPAPPAAVPVPAAPPVSAPAPPAVPASGPAKP
ncbi:MAG: hypothetical protein KGS60_09615 [Verrucomicrobia bacterium]|nr:hypothetical protein [Verrucomicrobiota bacterium]